jgi:hypothetical protein
MDLQRIKKITIAHLDFLDLTNNRTANPVAEAELPEIFRRAIKAGVQIEITDPNGFGSFRLGLDQNDQFQIVPLI